MSGLASWTWIIKILSVALDKPLTQVAPTYIRLKHIHFRLECLKTQCANSPNTEAVVKIIEQVCVLLNEVATY